jgi:hypothetical protein
MCAFDLDYGDLILFSGCVQQLQDALYNWSSK